MKPPPSRVPHVAFDKNPGWHRDTTVVTRATNRQAE